MTILAADGGHGLIGKYPGRLRSFHWIRGPGALPRVRFRGREGFGRIDVLVKSELWPDGRGRGARLPRSTGRSVRSELFRPRRDDLRRPAGGFRSDFADPSPVTASNDDLDYFVCERSHVEVLRAPRQAGERPGQVLADALQADECAAASAATALGQGLRGRVARGIRSVAAEFDRWEACHCRP